MLKKTANPTCHVGKFEENPTYHVLLRGADLSYDFITERNYRLLTIIRCPHKGQKKE